MDLYGGWGDSFDESTQEVTVRLKTRRNTVVITDSEMRVVHIDVPEVQNLIDKLSKMV